MSAWQSAAMVSLKRQKRGVRRRILAWRKALSPQEIERRSRWLTRLVIEHPLWAEARGVAAFVGVRGEPDTRALLEATLAAGKLLWLPRVSDDRARIEFHRVDSLAALVPGVMGLLEPPAGEVERLDTAEGLELIVVPGLAFDRAGRRLGFGRGHYDRVLTPMRGRGVPARVGVCFEAALEPDGAPIPVGEHDVPMHWVMTEERRLSCAASGRAQSGS